MVTKNLDTAELIQTMLKKAAEITKKYDTIAQATGSSFNMFELVNVAEDEVRMCRVLADLLNPEGTHRQGRIYLDLFFETVLEREKPVKNINVKREVVIEDDRRIDIVIEYDNYIIPIEVKINAGDQPNQLYDYAQQSKVEDGAKIVYYLTKFGTGPSEDSCCTLEKEEIVCISWDVHILKWLEACISHYNTYTKAPIREILIQFAAVIRKFTDQLEENEKMKIEALLLQSPENMKGAHNIEVALEGAKKKLLQKFRSSLVVELESHRSFEKNDEKDDKGDVFKDWNIGYKLTDENNNRIRVVRISYEMGMVKKIIQILKDDWTACPDPESKPIEEYIVFKLNDDSFFNLANANELNAKIDECKSWVFEKLNSYATILKNDAAGC